MFKSIFNKRLSRIVDASWSCVGQEDELIDLSNFPQPCFLLFFGFLQCLTEQGLAILL